MLVHHRLLLHILVLHWLPSLLSHSFCWSPKECLMPHLHFEGGGEVFPCVVQLVAEHLHGEPLHDAGPRHHQLLVEADAALGEGLQLRAQLAVTPAVPLGNLQCYGGHLAFCMQSRYNTWVKISSVILL